MREARNEAARLYRAKKRAIKIVEGKYRAPTSRQIAQLDKLNGKILDAPHQSSLNKRELYLAILEKGAKRSVAAEQAGISYSTVKYWRRVDERFRLKEAEVEETFLDNVEDVVRQLAQANDLKAALVILERRRPEVWAPRQKTEITHTLQFAGSLEERMQRINTLMEVAKAPELEPVIWDAEVVEDTDPA